MEERGTLEVTTPSTQTRRLIWRGPLHGAQAPDLLTTLEKSWPSSGGSIVIDLAACTSLDSLGAAALLTCWRRSTSRKVDLKIEGASEDVLRALTLFRVDDEAKPATPATVPVLEGLGQDALSTWEELVQLFSLAADSVFEMVHILRHPSRLSGSNLIQQMSLIGAQALGTVGLITFLIGLTLAFQSAHQLRQFGASIFVASLTAVAMFREMGPLMTAILVAGRSGSAIAAEIATMKVSEELDALEVMGISFVRFLVIPRLLALLLMMPLLVILSNLIGIAGGLVVGLGYLDLSLGPYLSTTLDALGSRELTMSLSKAVTFGLGIGLIALNCGRRVLGGAQEVGTATTRAVVQSLFFIILMDALFSILFYVVLK